MAAGEVVAPEVVTAGDTVFVAVSVGAIVPPGDVVKSGVITVPVGEVVIRGDVVAVGVLLGPTFEQPVNSDARIASTAKTAIIFFIQFASFFHLFLTSWRQFIIPILNLDLEKTTISYKFTQYAVFWYFIVVLRRNKII